MLLAIDTSAHLCAVILYNPDNNQTLAKRVLDIGRGHAEILMNQIKDCLSEAGCEYPDIKRIGVLKGPGSFTGIRVGLATARALRLSLNVDTVGVSGLEANEEAGRDSGYDGKLLTIVDAKRGQAFCKYSDNPNPFLETYEKIASQLPSEVTALCGSGSGVIQQHLHTAIPIIHEHATPPIEVVARLAGQAAADSTPPEPLYLRSADAKPQGGFALKMA